MFPGPRDSGRRLRHLDFNKWLKPYTPRNTVPGPRGRGTEKKSPRIWGDDLHPTKPTHTQRHCIVESQAQGQPPYHRTTADTRSPWAFVTACLPSVRLRIHQMVVEPTPDSCCNLASGHPLSCPQSYLSLSCQLTMFGAQPSSLVIAYCQEACLCIGSASQQAQPSAIPALHSLRPCCG